MTRRRPPVDPAFTLQRVDARMKEVAARLRMNGPALIRRIQRFARAAEVLLKPHRNATDIGLALSAYSQAEFYGGLWLVLIGDLFRDESEGARFAAEVIDLSEADCKALMRITLVVSEKYFGAPTPIE